MVLRVYGADVTLEGEGGRGAEDEGGFAEVFSKGYAARIVFLGILTLCQVVPCTPSTRSARRSHRVRPGRREERDPGRERAEPVLPGGLAAGHVLAELHGPPPAAHPLAVLMAVGLVVLGLFPTAPLPVTICAFGLYAFFSGGPGILQWLYPNELFPTEVRATAVGLAIGISRVGTIVATYGTPIFMAAFGIGPTMLVAAGLVILGLVLSIFMAPETAGKSLGETKSSL